MDELEMLPIPLLEWYRENARALPWRPRPGSRELGDPYRVWVSEIMLQQTRVAAVLDYYARFMEALPTVADLARAEEDRLMKLWQGLGYYSRARNLQKAARVVADELSGAFPGSYQGLLALPGIGEYTAGAIASIAFGLPEPAVDGNVLRVTARLTGDEGDILRPDTRRRMRAALSRVIPRLDPGDFNQALMDLGALVCLPNGAPLCEKCPARRFCRAHREGRTEALPVRPPKRARRVEERVVFLFFYQGKVALRRRPSKGLLAGLWEYPNALAPGEAALESWNLFPLSMEDGGAGKHVFTHIEWHMTCRLGELPSPALPEGWVWAGREELRRDYAVPSAFQAFAGTVEARIL